jgi:hypothetical protein
MRPLFFEEIIKHNKKPRFGNIAVPIAIRQSA